MTEMLVGDEVTLIGVPEWLLKDLPEEEQKEILSFVGKNAQITEIDQHKYYWIGFGATLEIGGDAVYSGHSFAVTADCLRKRESAGE